MRVSLYIKLLPLYIGLAALIASPFYLSYQHAQKVEAAAQQAQEKLAANDSKHLALSGKPVRIIMPELGIDVPVVDGYYMSSKSMWYVAPSAGTYAPNTYPINNTNGTTLIYGHWFNYVFGPTKNIKPGDKAIVSTDNGHIFQYVFRSEISVNPTDTEIFNHLDGRPTLKVMTCGGTWAQNRRIMTFYLVKAS
jgi:LPXTG-site transpeptidase (sortase) family protein